MTSLTARAGQALVDEFPDFGEGQQVVGSVQRHLALDYLDLKLIHQLFGDHQGESPWVAWRLWCVPGSPYAFYGLAPTLYDAPGRDHRDDLDWLAHTFLAHTPLGTTSVEAMLGFSWGFSFCGGAVQIVDPTPLDHSSWAAHRELFAAEHQALTFPTMLVR